MAKKKAEEPKDTPESGALETAAKVVGTAIGKIAKKTGLAGDEAPAPKKGKLEKKNKKRLPRKEKKAAQKAAAKKAAAKKTAKKG